jgi:Tetratricopeptide repeat
VVFGLEHPNVLRCVSNLGIALNEQGRYGEAEETNRRALKLAEKILGLEHSNTLTCIDNPGVTLGKTRETRRSRGDAPTGAKARGEDIRSKASSHS